ncbi:MAG: bifunctional phosphopantothenoylcysteine decarboxylase/phosphopantothenate synthase [Gemmataceae bacterium]|nr:bifunctional phosphopantothenoylcysteine decarboxylase/phosphopantothenate synthase [Gemmataceae bacterium]
MNFLITAGSPSSPIDKVRRVGTIFTGRTGAQIAQIAWTRGHSVTFLTSNPERLPEIPADAGLSERRLQPILYSNVDDLAALVQQQVRSKAFDVVIHAAGSTDYLVAGSFAPELGTYFNARTKEWDARGKPKMVEQPVDRINSAEPELWVRLVRAPRLIERLRDWGYRGLVVRFTIELGKSDGELRGAAEFTRKQSGADLVVASTMDSLAHWSLIGPVDGRYERVPRREVSDRLMLVIEHMRRTGQGSWHDHE